MGSVLLRVSVCAGTVVFLAGAGHAQYRPRALEELQRQREALETALIELSWQNHRDFAWPTFYTARFTNQDDIIVNRGDAEGVVGRTSDGKANPAQGSPRSTLKLEGQTWVYENDGMSARLEEESPSAEHIWRLRSLGASYYNCYFDIHEALWRDRVAQPGARTYRETIENGLHVVRAETDYGNVTWWIDAERGWSPIRVTLEQHGRIVRESRSTLKQFAGVWYTETVLFFSSRYRHGKQPLETLKVHAASFNNPKQPQRFTPADIGVEPGMMIEKVNADRTVEVLAWDGSRVVTQSEFDERVSAGEVQVGPTHLRTLAQLEAREAQQQRRHDGEAHSTRGTGLWDVGGASRRNVESEWEAYTRTFIETFQLNSEQAQKAWMILRQCQGQANRYLAKHAAELAKLERELAAAARAEDRRGREPLGVLQERRAKFIEGIDRIFEERLKGGLDQLPTRAQRRRAEAATQPSRPIP